MMYLYNKYTIIRVFIVLVLVIGILYLFEQTSPVEPLNNQKGIVTISEGSTTREIVNELKSKELIKSELIFLTYMKAKGMENSIKAGKYSFSQSMAMREIIRELGEGHTLVETVRFTIPEGFTVEQIAEKLTAEGLIKKKRFLELAKMGAFNYEFLNHIPNDPEIKYRVEGYLFPKTYEVIKGATEEEIMNVMLSQFQKEWNDRWDQVLKEKNLTQHQVITAASLIEKEAVVDQERVTIAGVVQNRIKKRWTYK